jgi:A/G-specific adenine glycosylase
VETARHPKLASYALKVTHEASEANALFEGTVYGKKGQIGPPGADVGTWPRPPYEKSPAPSPNTRSPAAMVRLERPRPAVAPNEGPVRHLGLRDHAPADAGPGGCAVVARFGGRLPASREELLTLPGIGPYSAGAIASIAFDRPEPLVDGNVTRVLCRLFCVEGNPKKPAVQARIWSLAEELLPRNRVGQFNQALMELGSEVCLPRSPCCDECPLRHLCLARKRGEQDSFPARAPKKKRPFHTVVVGVIYRRGRILIDKRRPEGLLGGLWEFPGGKQQRGESHPAALRREIREELALEVRVGPEIAAVDHTYTHFRIRLHAFECTWLSGEPRCVTCTDVKWVRPGDLGRYAFPAANKKIITILRARKGTTGVLQNPD